MFYSHKVKSFQFRWREALGPAECPYMHRWVLILFGYSIRLHHWHRSDDRRWKHNHPWFFVTLVLKGSYTDVSVNEGGQEVRQIMKAGNIAFRPSTHTHYADVPVGGCWTLLFCGRKERNWGFWVNNHIWRPLRYFNKWGHPPCSEQ